MASRIKVSVIIPAYNAERWISRAVRSVLQQSIQSIEVLVIDDCSTDATRSRVASLASADARIRLLAPARNLGPAGARNLALDAAQGEWLALLDADDAFHPDRLARLLEAAERTGVDIVADNQNLVRVDGSYVAVMWPEIVVPTFIDAATFIRRNFWGQSNPFGLGYAKPLLRRRLLEDRSLRYRADLRIAEDYQFLLTLLIGGERLLILPDALYDHTVRPDSITSTLSEGDLLSILRVTGEWLELAPPGPVLELLKRHRHTVELALAHSRVVASLKQGRLIQAAGTLMKQPQALRLVAKYGLQGLAKRLKATPPSLGTNRRAVADTAGKGH